MIDMEVHKTWGSFALDIKLRHEGGILGLLGASGCGKSKTLQCIAGIETPDAGKVVVGTRTFFDSQQRVNVPVPQRRVGYLFQHYALFPNMTVEENIRCGVRAASSKGEARRQVRDMMERLHLTGLEKQKPDELSGGQQQRVALARILVNEPDILLLDEPFSALDSYLKEKVMTELKDLLRQFPKDVILVTHSRDEAYQLCQSIAVLDDGRVSACAPTKELFANPQSRAAAILTGCKNIAAAQKAGPDAVFIPSWQVTLRTGRPVGDELCAIGIRGHAFACGDGENARPIVVTEEIEQPFEWIIKFRYVHQAAGTPDIWWRFAKPERPAALPDCLDVSGQDILLLYR
ncbi:MAG: ATP-binding cassette domain-containing protein [Megasphaera sp.]|jgi:molybdate transport system ATP-binding protein|uniref:sulfate/molybdate ABC transporter ATP-binding protein n=1 Tax=Megasphaera sp. TaxID=2023260 RepID=UPI0025BEB4E5|nr:ATP-binding cassette domain-containing protein [Megasphaera sp.]MCF0153742.1 ATP-binding cassette domain-containing protein [Megasphaera sp.]MCI7600980.1 ATP-binding cassette domain-containing protein [Megasphaera sp.]